MRLLKQMNIINNSFILISKKLSPKDHDFINSDKYDSLEKMIDDLDSNNFLNELYSILDNYFDTKLQA